jgi:diacylglycerol diphosphate phosphatase/phosphatidate phosphatase
MAIANVATVRSFWDWHHSTLGREFLISPSGSLDCRAAQRPSSAVLLSLSTSGVLTQIVKITAGRPRPGSNSPQIISPRDTQTLLDLDLIDRCQPIPGSKDANPFGLVTAAICTQKDQALLKDGFQSFFSGHSSRKLTH